MKRKLSTLAVLGLAAVVSTSAFADTVTYSTTGLFQNNSNVLAISNTNGDASITFLGVTDQVADIGVLGDASLGQIRIKADGKTGKDGPQLLDFSGATFTLQITQSSPPVGGSNTDTVLGSSTLTGTLKVSKSTDDSYTFSILFGGATANIPPGGPAPVYVYQPSDFNVSGTIQSDATGKIAYLQTQTLNGTVTVENPPVQTAPLPLAAWGGIGLMGLLTGSKALRNRNQSKELI